MDIPAWDVTTWAITDCSAAGAWDLTDVSNRLTQEEIVSILSNSGANISPVMHPIYTTHPLTESEQADLMVFMTESAGEQEVDKEWGEKSLLR